ncbi:hypothetical protein C8F04DRAFT_1113426 [Mycena alexandri]|uniref:Uncharacterized protein n=1 Tax=Mycena alexandri TaxID=1745969 RepID=A0AAD6SMC1_9AGAR|nr:hypothetical protein C8F04DRAFT_1113426 [Mycena alexandri]
MGLLGHVVGGAFFGLGARFWQLGILRRPMMENPVGHVACVTAFGGAGYYWWKATVYMQDVLAEKEAELRLKRKAIQDRDQKVLERELESPAPQRLV